MCGVGILPALFIILPALFIILPALFIMGTPKNINLALTRNVISSVGAVELPRSSVRGTLIRCIPFLHPSP